MRIRAKIDDNQPAIVQALLNLGCSVQSIAPIGLGCPDLLVGIAGLNLLMEVKDGDKIPSERKLTPDEKKWHANWKGQKAVVESPQQAVDAVRAYLTKEQAA